jgi:hypothetical protein
MPGWSNECEGHAYLPIQDDVYPRHDSACSGEGCSVRVWANPRVCIQPATARLRRGLDPVNIAPVMNRGNLLGRRRDAAKAEETGL